MRIPMIAKKYTTSRTLIRLMIHYFTGIFIEIDEKESPQKFIERIARLTEVENVSSNLDYEADLSITVPHRQMVIQIDWDYNPEISRWDFLVAVYAKLPTKDIVEFCKKMNMNLQFSEERIAEFWADLNRPTTFDAWLPGHNHYASWIDDQYEHGKSIDNHARSIAEELGNALIKLDDVHISDQYSTRDYDRIDIILPSKSAGNKGLRAALRRVDKAGGKILISRDESHVFITLRLPTDRPVLRYIRSWLIIPF